MIYIKTLISDKYFDIKIIALTFITLSFILTYKINENSKTQVEEKNNINKNKLEFCYMPFDNTTIKIIHLIMTRFMIEFGNTNGFPNKL